MLSKLYNLLAVLSMAALLSLGSLVGYLVAFGKLDRTKAQQIVKLIRGDLEIPETQEQDQTQQAAASQPAAAGASSAEAIAQQRRLARLHRAALDRAQRDLAARRELLDQVLADLITRQEQFEREKDEWVKRQQALLAKARDEGFARELAYIAKLSPKLGKDHLMRTYREDPTTAVRILNALSPSVGQRILDQFRSPEELQVLHDLLARLREANPDSAGRPQSVAERR